MTAERERLEELRKVLRAEEISYGELHELQGLAAHIEPGDVELLEAAGVPEFPDTEPRDPDELMTTFRAAARGQADIDIEEVLWAMFADVQDSYDLALQAAGVDYEARAVARRVVDDYLANHYGED